VASPVSPAEGVKEKKRDVVAAVGGGGVVPAEGGQGVLASLARPSRFVF